MTDRFSWEALCTSSFQKLSPTTFRRLATNSEVGSPELRAYIYSDVHLRGCESPVLFADLSVVRQFVNLAEHVDYSSGWHLSDGELHKDGQFSLLPEQFHNTRMSDGSFAVALPRLRANALPGWLTVESIVPPVLRTAWRLYLPGVSLVNFAKLMEFMDTQTYLRGWSMKTSLAQNSKLLLVPRPDATVIYFDPAFSGDGSICALTDALKDFAPAEIGPGFSIQLSESVWLGGPASNSFTSFGAEMSKIAAECLIKDDFNELRYQETEFRKEMASIV